MNKTTRPKLTLKGGTAIIDASGLILGRLASHVAKRLLVGEEVIVINAEKAVISGGRKNIIEEYKKSLSTRTLGSQTKAPKHSRRPETFIRRVIRGMVPWKKKARGKMAYGRLRVYIGLPEAFRESSVQTIPTARKAVRQFMTVGQLMELFGWKNPLKETS